MAKAKRGQTVRHNKTGHVGVIQSVLGGVVDVIFRDGSRRQVHSSQVSSAGGCLIIVAIPILALIAGVIAYGSQTA